MKTLSILLFAPAVLAAQQVPTDSLHPINLDSAVALALQNAPAEIAAEGAIRSSQSNVRAAYASLLPDLSWSMGQSQQSGSRFGPNGQLVPYTAQPWSFSTGLRSSITLFDGGKKFADLRTQKSNVSAAQANEVSQRFNLALQVKTQYANILAARESESAALSQLEQANEQLKAAAARVSAGAATVSDSLRSVVAVGTAQLALLQARNNVQVASAALTRLVGVPYLVTAEPSDTLDHTLAPVDSAQLLDLALQGPAVKQAQANLSAARTAQRSAKSGYLPTITASYNRAGNGFDKFYGLGGSPFAYGNTISFSLSYPLWNQFSRENGITQAEIATTNAEAQARDARLAAQQNLITQLAALRTADAQIRINQASVNADQEDLRVQQQRYTLGASTLLDLLTSQSNLNRDEAALIQARQSYRIARAQIEAIIGRDLK